MSKDAEVLEKVREMVAKDPRYRPEAYDFVRGSLDFAASHFGIQGHLTGRQLLEGIRLMAVEQYGPMAKTVMDHWGVHRTQDFGDIVFNMIEAGLLSKTESDRRDDFTDVYDFEEVFERKYPWHNRG
ncbi:MAG: hypothetical protein KAW17_10875 [Candidatus Eisenbacteria sp.]|nr:hypothetical protein [Candidatus Eisenbacteria bacterium]